jgi:hypothetical protein
MIAREIDFTKLQHYIYDKFSKRIIESHKLEHIILDWLAENEDMNEEEIEDHQSEFYDIVGDVIDILIECGFIKMIKGSSRLSIKRETK